MSAPEKFAINGRFLTQPKTGVQRYALNVIQSMGQIVANSGKSVTLLAPHSAQSPEFHGIALTTVGRSQGQIWEQVVLPKSWSKPLLNLCNIAPAFKTNQVICIHDANVFLAPDSYGRSFRTFYKIVQPLLARRSAQITTVSHFSAQQIAQFLPLKASDIAVLPNGYEHVKSWDSRKAVLAPTVLADRQKGAERPFVLALGSRARHKNVAMLLSLSEQLEALNLDLVIAGGGSQIFSVEHLQSRNNVYFLGFVTDHDLAYLFERAMCLAFPSLTEGFGLPALEAMALGCPVLSTDRASLPEICGNAALLLPPNQPQLWLEHIEMLLREPSMREDLIGRGRAQAAKYSWSNTASCYMDLMASF